MEQIRIIIFPLKFRIIKSLSKTAHEKAQKKASIKKD